MHLFYLPDVRILDACREQKLKLFIKNSIYRAIKRISRMSEFKFYIVSYF